MGGTPARCSCTPGEHVGGGRGAAAGTPVLTRALPQACCAPLMRSQEAHALTRALVFVDCAWRCGGNAPAFDIVLGGYVPCGGVHPLPPHPSRAPPFPHPPRRSNDAALAAAQVALALEHTVLATQSQVGPGQLEWFQRKP